MPSTDFESNIKEAFGNIMFQLVQAQTMCNNLNQQLDKLTIELSHAKGPQAVSGSLGKKNVIQLDPKIDPKNTNS